MTNPVAEPESRVLPVQCCRAAPDQRGTKIRGHQVAQSTDVVLGAEEGLPRLAGALLEDLVATV
jgi:hypothetical protein